jgi:chromo domain-containing protein 1
VRLWSLGVQEGIEYDPALSDSPPKLRQDCIEVFPFGGFIYITDDVFENEPQLALQIVQLFFTKIDKLRQLDGPVSPWHKVDDCTLVWRLCVRPELMEYLFARCEEQQDALEAGDPDVTARAALYTLLSENDYIEQDSPVQPLSAISVKYPIMSERRIIAEEPPVDYFNTLARNPEEANLRMIQYYGGLQVDMRRDYRQFYVVHTEPSARCARQWKQEIHSLADVISPEQCVKELSKSGEAYGKQPMFDFCERYMPPVLQKQPETEAHVRQITDTQVEQVKSVASPQVADSQMSLDDGEIRETQQSLEDGEIRSTQEESRR